MNNYLEQTMGNNVRSGVKLVACLCFLFRSVFQTEVSFIWIFLKVLRIEKPCVVLKILDQRTYYVNRNLVPRVLSLPRESTLVTAGHVSARF